MGRERLERLRGLFTEPGAAQNDDVLDLIDALLADDEPADRPAGRIVYVVLCGPGQIALDAFDSFDDAQRFARKVTRRVVVRARLEEEP